MSRSLPELLRRWFGATPERRPVRASSVIYERTPRPSVSFDWRAPDALVPTGFLHVDDVGPVRWLGAERVVVGARLDETLPDLELGTPGTIGLALRTTLQGGASWTLVPLSEHGVLVEGAPILGPTRLGDGDVLTFEGGLELRIGAPDPASAACVLELAEGREDFGARRAVLQPTGVRGRVRIGRGARCHLSVPSFEGELEIEREADGLVLSADARLSAGGAEPLETLRLAFPPQTLTPVDVGGARGARPPFGVVLGP